MPGPICKHYYNNGLTAFAEANTAAILDAEKRGLIKPETAHALYDGLAEIEAQAYKRMCSEVTETLVRLSLVSPKIWEMWAKPE